MSRLAAVIGVVCLALIGALVFFGYWNGEEKSFALLTDEQVIEHLSSGDIPDSEISRALTVTDASGPSIRVTAPNGDRLKSPVNFDIQIEPRNGIRVDLTSIKIEYRLGPAWVNLTRRVMQEASVKGSRLVARGLNCRPESTGCA